MIIKKDLSKRMIIEDIIKKNAFESNETFRKAIIKEKTS